jgi:hypothetical protein
MESLKDTGKIITVLYLNSLKFNENYCFETISAIFEDVIL